MIQMEDVLKEATASLEAALVNLKWEEAADARQVGLIHYTGRGPEWRIELVVLGKERMGSAVRGSLILKLTDAQAEIADQHAVNYLMRTRVCGLCGEQEQHTKHWNTKGAGDFCPFLEKR